MSVIVVVEPQYTAATLKVYWLRFSRIHVLEKKFIPAKGAWG